MRIPESQVQRSCVCGGGCPRCRTNQLNQGHGHLQTSKYPHTNDVSTVESTAEIDNAVHSSGRSLDAETKAFMETRFDHDFSQVRIHTDSQAANSAKALNAKAYTFGQNVIFGAGRYAPGTHDGKRLLAHELTHVVQQKRQQSSPPLLMRQTIQSQLPPNVGINRASVSFELPGGRLLTNNWNDLSTTAPTTVTLSISPTGLRLRFSPSLLIDAQWPLSDLAWSGLDYDFATATISRISLRSTQTLATESTLFVETVPHIARSAISDFFMGVLEETPLAPPGYDPLTDADPMGTLRSIQGNWASLPSSGAQVTAADITDTTIGASVTFSSSTEIGGTEDGRIVATGGVNIRIRFAGTLADVIGSDTERPRPRLEWLRISGNSIVVQQEGEDVARLESIRVGFGGTVRIDRLTLLGRAARLSESESSARMLALIILLSGGRPEDRLAVGTLDPNLDPTAVPEAVREQIEEALTRAVIQLIRENADAIPGFDLTEILGVGRLGDYPQGPPSAGSSA